MASPSSMTGLSLPLTCRGRVLSKPTSGPLTQFPSPARLWFPSTPAQVRPSSPSICALARPSALGPRLKPLAPMPSDNEGKVDREEDLPAHRVAGVLKVAGAAKDREAVVVVP